MEYAHPHKGKRCAVIHEATKDRDSVTELWLRGKTSIETHTHTVLHSCTCVEAYMDKKVPHLHKYTASVHVR